jgi:AcrR family transcriptional regulator
MTRRTATFRETIVEGGRPRSFDVDEALDRALPVFWRQGCEGTAISDLTKAMGINPPSLYSAFGNKEELFRKVLDRYAEGPARYIREAFDLRTARAAVEHLLRGAADGTTSPEYPHGCLTVQGGLVGEGVGGESARRRAAALRGRLERALEEGSCLQTPAPKALAATSRPFTRASRCRRQAVRAGSSCTRSSTWP